MKRLVILVLTMSACGAQTLRVEPVKVEPIHVTVDVNLHDHADIAKTVKK